jgi:hypothetical protein
LKQLKSYVVTIVVGDLEWRMFVPHGAQLSDEEIRVMLERDYLRELDNVGAQ